MLRFTPAWHQCSGAKRSSTYVEDIDQKGWKFCAKCRKEMGAGEFGVFYGG